MADLQNKIDGKAPLEKSFSRETRSALGNSTAPSARRDSTRGSVGMWIFAAGLTGVFLIQMFFIGGIGIYENPHYGVQRFMMIAWALALGGLLTLAFSRRDILKQDRGLRRWITAYAVVFAIILCRGFLNWEIHAGGAGQGLDSALGLLNYYLQQSLVLIAPLIVIPFGGLLMRSKPFQLTVALHAACGGLLGLAVILQNGLSTRVDYLDRDLGVNFSGGLPFYAMPLALLLLPYLPKLLRVAVLGGAVGWFAYVATFQTRISSVMFVCVLCLVIGGALRNRHRKGLSNVRFTPAIVVVGIVLGGLFLNYSLKDGSLSEGIEALGQSWQGDRGVSDTVSGNIRYDEARIVIEQMSPFDWVLGRGIGGTWSDARIFDGEIRTMVHLGYLDFVFIGGLGMCWLCCVFPLVCAVRGWRQVSGLKYVAVAFVLIRAIELLAYGLPEFSPKWLVTCVCLGVVLEAHPRLKRETPSRLRAGRGIALKRPPVEIRSG